MYVCFVLFSYKLRSQYFKAHPRTWKNSQFYLSWPHIWNTRVIEGSCCCCCCCRWCRLQITQTNAFLSLGREVKVLVYKQLEKSKKKKRTRKRDLHLAADSEPGAGGVRKLISSEQAVRDEAKQMARLWNGKTGSRCGRRFSPCITGNQPVGEEICITGIIWYQNCP